MTRPWWRRITSLVEPEDLPCRCDRVRGTYLDAIDGAAHCTRCKGRLPPRPVTLHGDTNPEGPDL